MTWVAMAGQFDNVGDTLHRRVLLDRLRGREALSLHIGSAPESFLAGLELDGAEKLYTSAREWASSALARSGRDSIFAFTSGEIRLSRARALREFALAPVTARVQNRGGRIARIGIAAGSGGSFQDPLTERILRSAIRRTDLLAWRELRSQSLFGTGILVPDLGFAAGGAGLRDSEASRTKLALTMRFDRPTPPRAWLDGLRIFATRLDLQLVVTSQVRRDNARSRDLATELDAVFDPWPVDHDHRQREDRLRRLYQDCALVVSDRLHALILAATEGAAVAAASPALSDKIPRHFAAIDHDLALPAPDGTAEDFVTHLAGEAQRRLSLRDRVLASREAIDSTLRSLLGS